MSDAVMVFIGTIAGTIVGSLGTFLTLRFNYRQLYAKTVLENRNLWSNELREFIAKMVAEAYIGQNHKKTKEYFIYRNQVLMKLNLKEHYHKIIEQLINDFEKIITQYDYDKNFALLQDKIIAVSRNVMKIEWETVKAQAKGVKIG